MSQTTRVDGYYDASGKWQRTKFCHVQCPPERCTCAPPLRAQLSEAQARVVELERGQHWLADMPFFREQIANAKIQTPYGEGLPAPWSFLSMACDCVDALANRLAEIEREQPRCEAALRTLTGMGYYWGGGAYFKPPQSDAAPVSPAAQVAQGVADDVVRDAVIGRVMRRYLSIDDVGDDGIVYGLTVLWERLESDAAEKRMWKSDPGDDAGVDEVFALLAAAQQQKSGG